MSRPKRNPNFTTAEISILTEEVEKRKDVIFSRQNSSVTNQAKKGEWDLICEKVNAVNTSHLRTADELKKKWSVLCSETKKKISKIKREQVRTGGGQLPADCSVTPVEDKIQSIIGETAISGVDGGIDTLEEVSYGMAGKGALIITEVPAADQSLEGSTDTIATCTSSTSNRQTSTVGAKKRKIDVKTPSLDLIDVEKERLEIEKKRLDVEMKRLEVEEQRLAIERTRLQLEQEKHSIKLCQLGIISNATITSQQ